jgi:adenosine kinase
MNLIVTGSVAFDYLMRFPGFFRDHILPDRLDSISLSFLVESMTRQRGGTAPNIAFNLALFGTRARLFATAGVDFEEYGLWLESRGVDISLVRILPDEFTASFFVNTDQSNAQIASFYPGAMAFASELSIYELIGDPPDLVIISPNYPAAMLRYVDECIALGIPYLYDPSQQIVRLDAADLEKGVTGALGVCLNDYEFALLQSKLGLSSDELVLRTGFFVVTKGSAGATIYDRTNVYSIPAVAPIEMVDPTGVGDAFRGGFLTGYMRGWDLAICGRMGALAATYCLESKGPQGQAYSLAEFVGRFRQNFADDGRLDELLIKTDEIRSGEKNG